MPSSGTPLLQRIEKEKSFSVNLLKLEAFSVLLFPSNVLKQ